MRTLTLAAILVAASLAACTPNAAAQPSSTPARDMGPYWQYLNFEQISQILGISMLADEMYHGCQYWSLGTTPPNDVNASPSFAWDRSAKQDYARDKA